MITAEEFRLNQPESPLYASHEVNRMLIEFGKLCATEALKAASEKAVLSHKLTTDFGNIKSGFHLVATKDSILNAYDLNQIK